MEGSEDIFWAWLCLTNAPKLSESKYQASFGVIILGQNPLTFMIPIYSTTALYDNWGVRFDDQAFHIFCNGWIDCRDVFHTFICL